MHVWLHTLHLSDVFHDDTLPFETLRDTIVARVRALSLHGVTAIRRDDLAEELADTADVEEFDAAWAEFYDFADATRIWVETWGRRS